MHMIKANIALALAVLGIVGCNVDTDDTNKTEGVTFGGAASKGGAGAKPSESSRGGSAGSSTKENQGGSGGETRAYSSDTEQGAGGASEPSSLPKPVCERGLVIVNGDYKSTNISITDLDGTTRSASFVSSGSAKPGLAMALSSDVDVPRVAPASGKVVLLDRFGTNVVTFMEIESATVLGQLPVGTGFESNPYDYLEFDTDRAIISRFGDNFTPGKEEFDGGSDLLILDTKSPKILDRIAMPEEDENLLPRPGGMTMLGDTVVVSLQRLSADYKAAGKGRFVGVSPKEKRVVWTVDVDGLKNCGRLAKSPSGKTGAVACSSKFDSSSRKYNPEESDVVLYDLTVSPPKELRRLGLGKKADAGIQHALEFASETKLLALAYGGNSTDGDRALAVDASTGDFETLIETTAPYSVMSAHCAPGCGDVCVIADAEKGKLRRFKVSENGEFKALDDVTVDSTVGLPPHYIGAL